MKTFQGLMTRRSFLKAAAGLAAAGAGGLGSAGCAPRSGPFDLVIRGAAVFDGKGGDPFPGDVGIIGQTIERVGKISISRAKRVINAEGLALAPGFIDVHDHTSTELFVNPKAESAVRQGVTTLVSGNCGDSPFPLNENMAEELRKNLKDESGMDLTWRDAAGFFSSLQAGGLAVNYASFVGQGTIRAAAMGFGNRAPSGPEMEAMKAMVRESLQAGAVGVSTGLEYTPSSFASTEEIIELCRAAAPFDGIYATHMRDEEDNLLEAVEEAVRIAKESGLRLQISHLKTGYPENWPKIDTLLSKIENARSSGLDVFCDRYPYIAGATGLSSIFPMWSREGPAADFIARLKDPALQERLRAEVDEKGQKYGSWEKILISKVGVEKNKWVEGKNILEASGKSGKSPFEFMRDLLIEEKAQVGMIIFSMSEDNLRRILAHPLVGVGADGSAVAPYGRLGAGKPHPRLYGTFPRVLGKYVRQERLLPMGEMIKKMTSIPAGRFGLGPRGVVAAGRIADLVVFDPEKIIDRATWTDPQQYPEGIPYVIVNGQVVVDEGEHTGRLPGFVLRRTRKEKA